MNRIEQANTEIQALQAKIDAGSALIKELDQRAKEALKTHGFNSPEYHALCAAIGGIGNESQRIILLIAEIQNEVLPPCSHGGDI